MVVYLPEIQLGSYSASTQITAALPANLKINIKFSQRQMTANKAHKGDKARSINHSVILKKSALNKNN